MPPLSALPEVLTQRAKSQGEKPGSSLTAISAWRRRACRSRSRRRCHRPQARGVSAAMVAAGEPSGLLTRRAALGRLGAASGTVAGSCARDRAAKYTRTFARSAGAGPTACTRSRIRESAHQLFDLVAAPVHDGLSGDNTFVTLTAPHRFSPKRLKACAPRRPARSLLFPRHAWPCCSAARALPSVPPRASSARRRARFAQAAARLARHRPRGAPERHSLKPSWLPSRMCPALSGMERATIPISRFPRPRGRSIVTADSVNMITEAAGPQAGLCFRTRRRLGQIRPLSRRIATLRRDAAAARLFRAA